MADHQRFAKAFGPVIVFLLLLALIGGIAGCESAPEGQISLSETISDPTDGDDPLSPAESGAETAELSFLAKPIFCCNPLTLDFTAAVSDSEDPTGMDFQWDFGRGKTSLGVAVRHTFPWAGTHRVVLKAALPQGVLLSVERDVTVTVDANGESGVVISSPVDGATNGPQPPDSGLPLSAYAGPDQQIQSNDSVHLVGRSNRSVESIQFEWQQVSGPKVELFGASSSTASFNAPQVEDGPILLVFELRVSDDVETATDRATITIELPGDSAVGNAKPTVADRTLSIAVDQTIVIDLSGTDADGDTLSFSIPSRPIHGVLGSVKSTAPNRATVMYTPALGFTGPDSFTFQANDGTVSSSTARVTINVGTPSTVLVIRDSAHLVPINTTVRISLSAEDPENDDLTISISSPPAHGMLGPVEKTGKNTAQVTYTPSSGFQGTDQFRVTASDGTSSTLPATATLQIQKLLVPWMEVNAPLTDASTFYTADQGVEPGMSVLDYCLKGLESWSRVTNTVIITTHPSEIDNLYPELMRRRPETLRVIGGLKTFLLPGVREGDERPYDFADTDGWREIASQAQRVAAFTKENVVVLENETSLEPFTIYGESIDYAKLSQSLRPLRDSGVTTWWNLPVVMSDIESFPDRRAESIDFVTTIRDALSQQVFLTGYRAWYYWQSTSTRPEEESIMLDLVGPERMLEGMFVTLDGYIYDPEYTKRVFTPAEVIQALPAFPDDLVRLYPGAANWISVGETFDLLLPNLGVTLPDY